MTSSNSTPLKPAYLVLCRGGSLFDRGIRWVLKRPRHPVFFNHLEIVYKAGDIKTAEVLAQMWRCKVHSLYDIYAGKNMIISIYECLELNEKDAQAIADDAYSHLGQFYNVGMIPLQFVDGILGKVVGREVVFARKLSTTSLGNICSVLGTMAYWRVKKWTFGVPARMADPDDVATYCAAHPEKYRLVFGPSHIYK